MECDFAGDQFKLLRVFLRCLCNRSSVVEGLQDSSDNWVIAVADKNTSKLHQIVNGWLVLNITPAEFLRVGHLGIKTVQSAISGLGDASLAMKLNKV
jgi:hypothetical protein